MVLAAVAELATLRGALWALAAVAIVALRKLWALLAKFFAFAALIWAERRIVAPLGIKLRFPRDVHELRDLAALERFLKRAGLLAAGRKVLRVESIAEIESEPDKNQTSAAVRVVHQGAGQEQEQTLQVFFKFQTGKGMPLWLQALRSAAEPGIAREVDFYSLLADTVPLRTPKPLYAGKLPSVNLVCLALEYIPIAPAGASAAAGSFQVVPDSAFDAVEDMSLMVTGVAKMHAMFLGRVADDPRSSWIPAKQGLDFCKWAMDLGTAKQEKACVQTFEALHRFFCNRPMTLVHGDCRPGNMIFAGAGATRSVIFADWEATNAAPLAWDFTYCTVIGLPPATRAARQAELLDVYRAALSEAGVAAADLGPLADEVELLTLALFFVSHAVVTGGFWSKQGNTKRDLESWKARVLSALAAVDATRAGKLLGIGAAPVEATQALGRKALGSS